MTPRRTVKPVRLARLWAVVDPRGESAGAYGRGPGIAVTSFLGLEAKRWDEYTEAGYRVVEGTFTPDKPRTRR